MGSEGRLRAIALLKGKDRTVTAIRAAIQVAHAALCDDLSIGLGPLRRGNAALRDSLAALLLAARSNPPRL